jgi:hypothetical protein
MSYVNLRLLAYYMEYILNYLSIFLQEQKVKLLVLAIDFDISESFCLYVREFLIVSA